MKLRFICHITINLVIKRINIMQKAITLIPLPKSHPSLTPPRISNFQVYQTMSIRMDSMDRFWVSSIPMRIFDEMMALKWKTINKTHVFWWRLFLFPSTLQRQMIIRTQLKRFAPYFCRALTQIKTTTRNIPLSSSQTHILTNKSVYHFANIPIDSKYYHTQLPIKVTQILDLITQQKKLNEKALLLEHLAEVVSDDPRIILSKDQQARINRELRLWKGRKGRFEKVATIAWVIKKLRLFKHHKDLYEQIAERVSNDEWYVNFDESLKALEAFTYLENEELKNEIYPRIQRNLNITVWEFNMTYYQRITVGLLENQRFQSQLWDKLQDHILKNLGMEYSLKTITDIFTSYALAQKGSDIFYQMLQKTIYLGHWYSYDIKHKILPGYDQTGQFYALLVQTYSISKTNCDIHLLPDFLEYIYSGVANRTTNYQKLSSFTKIIQYLPGLFDEEDEQQIISNLLNNKKPNSIAYQEIIEFYDLMSSKGKEIPLSLHQHVEKVLLSDINKKLIPPSKVLEITEELFDKNYVLNPQEFQQAITNCITVGFKYLQAQQAKAVLELSSKSRFLPTKTKELLALPFTTVKGT